LLVVGADARPFENDGLGVGELLIVIEKVFAAQSGDRRRMRVDAEAPARDIEVVNAVVAHIPRAEGEPPAPVAMKTVRLMRNHRRGTDPVLIIDGLGRFGRHESANGSPLLTIPDADRQNVADGPFMYHAHGGHVHFGAAALRANLT